MRFLDQGDDPIQGAVTHRGGGGDLQGSVPVDGPGEDLVAGGLGDRHRFAGDGSLIDGRTAAPHLAIDRHPFSGPHDDQIPGDDPADRDLYLCAVAPEAGHRRRQVGQGADRAARAVKGGVLQRVRQREEKEQEGALGPIAEDGSAGRGEEHQQIDVEAELAFTQMGEGVAQQIPGAEDVGGEVERDCGLVRQPEPVLSQPGHEQQDAGEETPGQFPVLLIPGWDGRRDATGSQIG